MQYLLIYLIIINALGFALMLADKRKAKKHTWRIPEHVLLGTAVIGGSLGTLLGMQIFRHKTKHKRFAVGVPVILLLQVLLGIGLLLLIEKTKLTPWM